MNISNWIANTGENQNFIAFMAHSGSAAYIVSRFPYGPVRIIAAIAAVIAAAGKEFVFDLKVEHTPPQTWKDSALDFAGYLTGIVIGTVWP